MRDEPLDFRRLVALKDAFADSDLPFRVDVVEWATTGEAFRLIIGDAWEIVAGE